MRWGIRKQNAPPSARCKEEENAEERGITGKGKGKGRGAFSFSPLSWLAKIAAKEKPGAAAPKNAAAAAAPVFPSSCIPKRSSPSPAAATVTPESSSFSPPRRSMADAAVPRRRSVGNDNADSLAARRKSCRHGRRHFSVGGDHELPPLGRLIPFSPLAGASSPARAAPADTDAATRAARARRHRRRRSSRRLSVSGGRRSSFSGSGRMILPPPRVRVVPSPRRSAVAASGLESLAVVRRTRDPQRAFRESMVEMIASASGGAAAPPRPEELERLLACYLSLNADEHHDVIVKVFRQVWFEYLSLLPRPEPGRKRRPPPATATARRC